MSEATARDWDPFAEVFAEEVRVWFRAARLDPGSRGAQISIDINSTRVPRRAEDLLRVLSEGTPLRAFRNLDVLDIGCGFGPFTVYLASVLGARSVIGSDIRDDFLDVGRRAMAKLGANGLRVQFERADMSSLPHPDASLDVVLVLNAFCYVTSWAAAEQAFRGFFRILRPGGVLLLYQPNLWCPIEMFTRLPFVHWLPRAATERLVRWSGRRNTYSEIQLWSPGQMARLGRLAGFKDVRSMGYLKWRLLTDGLLRFIAPYYYTTAIKPVS